MYQLPESGDVVRSIARMEAEERRRIMASATSTDRERLDAALEELIQDGYGVEVKRDPYAPTPEAVKRAAHAVTILKRAVEVSFDADGALIKPLGIHLRESGEAKHVLRVMERAGFVAKQSGGMGTMILVRHKA